MGSPWVTEDVMLFLLVLQMSAVTNRFQCPICMGEMKEPTLTPCRHRFCRQCLIKWLQQRQTCPSCNRSVEGSEIIKDHQFESLVGK